MSACDLMAVAPVRLLDDEPRIQHSIISKMLDLKPRYHLRQIERYFSEFESLGVLSFENAKPSKGGAGGRPERVALLNEDQSYLLVTYSRNSAIARQVKQKLVLAFRTARDGLRVRQQQYLPNYHHTHNAVQQMALHAAEAGSATPERIHHINIEKLINNTFGINAGTRNTLPPELQSAVSAAYLVISKSIDETLSAGGDHKQAYQVAKQRVHELARLVTPTARRLIS